MNLVELERKLIAAAKARPAADAVPYAFEQRIMARLGGRTPALDIWSEWSHALWRAAAPCLAVAIFLGIWTAFAPEAGSASANLSQDFEQTLIVAVTQDSESAW